MIKKTKYFFYILINNFNKTKRCTCAPSYTCPLVLAARKFFETNMQLICTFVLKNITFA